MIDNLQDEIGLREAGQMRLRRKLKSCKGFTLAETLLAVLILLLVSVIVANGMPAATDAYRKTVLSANAQSLMSTTVAALRDELGTAWDVSVTDDTITYYSAETGNCSVLGKDTDGSIILTEYNKNVGFNEESTSIGKVRELTPTATLTKDLTITYDSVSYTYNATGQYWIVEFKDIKVLPKGASEPVLAQMESLVIRIISASSSTPAPTVSPTDNT